MYIPKFNLSCDATKYIGANAENVIEIIDTMLREAISNIMGLTITGTWLAPEHDVLLCSYEDSAELIFKFSDDCIFPLEVTIANEERLFLNL